MQTVSSTTVTTDEIRVREDHPALYKGSKETKAENRWVRLSKFVGLSPLDPVGPDTEEGPQGFLVEQGPELVLTPHFHRVDQFQVVMAGDGYLGKHELRAVTIHYTDAYTPYGPIGVGPNGLTFFTLRAAPDEGSQYMPESRDRMKQKAGRDLAAEMDITVNEMFRRKSSSIEDVMPLQPDGTGAFALRLAPGDELKGPDTTGAGGQYYVVTSGSMFLEDEELPIWSCAYLARGEGAPLVKAGVSGCDVLVLQFGSGGAV